MNLEDKEETLVLKYIGDDSWSRPVYQDQFNHLWKDVDLGDCTLPSLYSAYNNEFDGEPDMPIRRKFAIEGKAEPQNKNMEFQYMLLGRLKSDCDYYCGYGGRNPKYLWAGTEKKQIEKIKEIWLNFLEDEKPEWLTWEQILSYEKEMCEGE